MITQTKTDRFRDLIQREVDTANEMGYMTPWDLYEHLKDFIPHYEIEHETAIRMITEILEV